MTFTNTEIAETLEEAADNLLIRGWSQGNLGSPDTSQCLDGHLMSACGFERAFALGKPCPLYSQTRDKFGDYIKTITGCTSIWGFNDLHVKDAGEARDHLLLAAKELRNNA